MIKICEHCGEEFEAKRSTARYCSSSCRIKAHRSKKQHDEKECESCGKKYTPTHGSQLYCSDYCKDFEAKESKRLRKYGWEPLELSGYAEAYDEYDYGDPCEE